MTSLRTLGSRRNLLGGKRRGWGGTDSLKRCLERVGLTDERQIQFRTTELPANGFSRGFPGPNLFPGGPLLSHSTFFWIYPMIFNTLVELELKIWTS